MERDRKCLTEQKVAHSKHVAKKRVEKGFHQMPLEEQTLLSQKLRTEHDRSWLNRTQEQQYAKLKRMMFKSYWRTMKMPEFYDEIKRVLPAFYSLCPDLMSKSKKALLDTGTTKEDNVFVFLKHVQQIAERKIEDDISEQSRVGELSNVRAEEYLLEFVKVDESVHMTAVANEEANKMEAMYKLMETFAQTTQTSQLYEKNFERPDYTVKTTSYCERDFMYCSDDEDEEGGN